jgi:hypothetical protein
VVTARSVIVVVVFALAMAACGEDEPSGRRPLASPDGRPERPVAVQATLDLRREATGPPDAGTQAGHQGGGAKGATSSNRFQFTGTAQPSEARVSVDGADARVDHRRDGVFVVTVRGLRRGATTLTVRASATRLKPWSETVRIMRR